MQSSNARDVFPTGNSKSQSCMTDHTNFCACVCAVNLKKLNIPLKTILKLSYFQCFLRQHFCSQNA